MHREDQHPNLSSGISSNVACTLPEAPPGRALGDCNRRGAQLSQLCVRCRALFVGFARHRRQHADEVEVLSRTCERLGALIDHFVEFFGE